MNIDVYTSNVANFSREICAVGVPMSAVPGQSRLWAVAEADDSRVLTWENFFLGGDTNAPVNAQIRLFANGDFTTRSSNVETVCRRVNPDDWDGDGLANEKDENPVAYDGDFLGVPNALPTNANLDAYYMLDVAAAGALDFATIRVTCDGPSDLGDHVVIARTNQVCRVPLLAGATYAVESDLPISYSAVSSEHAHIVTNSATNLTVSLPLEFAVERVEMRGGGSDSYIVSTSPVNVGLHVLSVSGTCCSCTTNDSGFAWNCGEHCDCGGFLHDISTMVIWEGYSRSFVWRGWCPCQERTGSDTPVAMLVFSPGVVLFEESFTNAYCQMVNARSTVLRLSGAVYGGEYGGTYSVVVSDGGRLEKIAESVSCSVTNVEPYAYHDFWVDYRAVRNSDSPEDITATVAFSPAADAGVVSASSHATAIMVSTYAHCNWIPRRSRKELGVGERVTIGLAPNEMDIPISIAGCAYTNLQWIYNAPATGGTNTITVSCRGVDFPIDFVVLEPEGIVATEVYCDTNNIPGVAGNFVGHFNVAVFPTNVSFQAILTAELGHVATNATGFFLSPEHAGLLDHSLHGANKWHGVGFGNMFYDMASFKCFYPPWGDGGSFTWPIENAWRLRSGPAVTNYFPWIETYDQRFELDSDGTTRIEKFDYSLQQKTNLEFSITRRIE